MPPMLDDSLGFENPAFGLPPFKVGSARKEHPIGEYRKGFSPQFRLVLFFEHIRPKQFLKERRYAPFAHLSVAAGPLNPPAVFVFKPVIPESSAILPSLDKSIFANLNRHCSLQPNTLRRPVLPLFVDSLLTVPLIRPFLAFF
jgi:hypothetical protein